jgi:uncharacterized phage protein (TIGR02220 family)
MAHYRLLNERIILSKKINSVSEGAEVLYYRLIVLADDFGRYHASPAVIKGKAFTLRKKVSESMIKARLGELWRLRLIDLYQAADEEVYLEIKRFENEQRFRADVRRRKDFPDPVTYSERPVSNTERAVPCSSAPGQDLIIKNSNKEEIVKNEEKKDILRKIIEYLNERAGTKYLPTTEFTIQLVHGRLAEGRTLEDFKQVIDVKVAEWKDDPKMNRFLRPETLFRPGHFESYLNQPPPGTVGKRRWLKETKLEDV